MFWKKGSDTEVYFCLKKKLLKISFSLANDSHLSILTKLYATDFFFLIQPAVVHDKYLKLLFLGRLLLLTVLLLVVSSQVKCRKLLRICKFPH